MGEGHGSRVGESSSTWRATNGAWWAALLGWIWAESRHGPKMKFAHLGLLYNFY
jgi:hypothetical protein